MIRNIEEIIYKGSVTMKSCFYGCCCSIIKSCLVVWDPMACSTLGFPVLHHFPEFAQTHVHRVGDAIQPSCPLSPISPLDLNLSQHQALFQWVSSLNQVAKDQSIGTSDSASVLPMNIQGWFPLGLTVLISLFLQHHSLKASILRCSAFFMVQLSHLYMTTGKIITLTL